MKQNCRNHCQTILKSAYILAMLLLAIGILSACNDQSSNKEEQADSENTKEQSVYPLTIKDEVGNDVTLPDKPTKIFAPVMEDSLLAFGIKPIMQWSNGVKPQLYLQDQLQGVPEISFASGPPSAESIMANKPDLIILHNSFYVENGTYEKYAKIAPTYVFNNAASDLEGSIKILGQLLDEPDKAEQALQGYQEKVDAAKTKLASITEGKKVALIRFNAKGMFFMTDEYFSGYVLTHELGFEQSSYVKNGAFEVSLEILPELDADYIFLINDGNLGDEFINELKDSKIWQSTAAFKHNQVFETSEDYWLNGGIHAQGKVIEDVLEFLAP
ncbi:MAG TPA: ferrichrome ABC transporter substrate-binding protein [Lysinibacillus sp.]|uniref:ABC transporter substrate-binding protein n=1 Tax=Lysinibacillus TaxID=400634 RepID=UPI0007389BB0|nr:MULTISPECIES: ABC transporter substrate-binding protein [unclassified Lysinibacillus]MEE3808857.1 ABC transporter substrate-binding protein [Lysinibacillus fusiformis]HBT72301.1 ferrichrome ABC transporter substrate-binding protein [Lysinibacillus sp.]KUF27182.1 ferrichrome ABC transporter substrate-binding protein [Lysinibacillus sp. F5]WCH48017.1 ABC transporter substrate-binding protein [Lysinibacillus sp. OF-1]SCY91676.1 iron complex transport system substrate-binding protein [Lysinibac